ncbi:MAG TPA: portal protein, partial [Nitrospira sp.]|nr:portal protein [Nitrospira sp.]
MTDDEIVQDVKDRFDAVAGTRGNWESVWEQIAERIFTQYAKQFVNRSAGQPNDYQGTQRTEEMVDATGALALTRFAAAMESMLTPRSSTWHYLKPADRTLLRNREARLWFEELNKVLFEYRYAPNANFASQKHEDYMMLGAFGTGCMFIDALQHHRERGLRYRAVHLGQMYFQENHQGLIDTALRRFQLTARQAA